MVLDTVAFVAKCEFTTALPLPSVTQSYTHTLTYTLTYTLLTVHGLRNKVNPML